MMKSLVCFYSRTGNSRGVGEQIAGELGADVEEIHEDSDRGRVLGFIGGIISGVLRRSAKIKPVEKDLSEYGLVVVGSPVWAGGVTPAVRAFLEENREMLGGCRIGCYCTYGGSPGKTFTQMQELAGKTAMATLGLSEKEIAKKEDGGKIRDFTAKLAGE